MDGITPSYKEMERFSKEAILLRGIKLKIKEIIPLNFEFDARLKAPPSKSYTHRALFIAALSEGKSKIIDPLISDDIKYTLDSLKTWCENNR